MKKLFPFILAIAIISSCKYQTGNDQDKAETTSAQHDEHDSGSSELQLNNGAKWKADSSTLQHVQDLKNIVGNYKQSGEKDIPVLANRLQESLNGLINDCKMSGPDHEALHHWLEPLLDKVKDLKNASGDKGQDMVKGISDQLELFQKYFD